MMAAKDYWKSRGKTPAATLYSAILRETNVKGAVARSGKFEFKGKGPSNGRNHTTRPRRRGLLSLLSLNKVTDPTDERTLQNATCAQKKTGCAPKKQRQNIS